VSNDLLSDGNVAVSWVPSIASIAAPTVAELNAGTKLEAEFITPDGLKTDAETGSIDTSSLGSTFNTSAAGRRKYDIALTIKRKTVADVAYNLLIFRAEGFVVVRRTVAASTAWIAGQEVEVYPVQCGEAQRVAPEENSVTKVIVPMFLTAEPDTRAVVAA
jgi:hypothetical protein